MARLVPGSPGEPIVLGDGYAEEMAGPVRTFEAPGLVKEGGDLTLEFFGQTDNIVGLLVGAGGGSQFMYGWEGQLLLSLNPASVFFFIVPMPAGTGYLKISTQFPEMGPGISDRIIFMQALFADSSGSPRLGTARTMVGLDETF